MATTNPSYVTYTYMNKDGTPGKIPADAFKRRMLKQRQILSQTKKDMAASSMSAQSKDQLSSMTRKYGQ